MFFKNGMFFKIANFIKMFTFFQNLYFFQNRKIFLIFLHIFNIFFMQKNPFKKFILFFKYWSLVLATGFCQDNIFVCLPLCQFVCPSAKVFAIISSKGVFNLLITMVPSKLRQNVPFGRYKYFWLCNIEEWWTSIRAEQCYSSFFARRIEPFRTKSITDVAPNLDVFVVNKMAF